MMSTPPKAVALMCVSMIAGGAGVGLCTGQASAQSPRYTMTVLGADYNDPSNPTKKSRALGINSGGQIVGEWDFQKPFVWSAAGGIMLLQGLPDPSIYNMPIVANKINDNGMITGLYYRNSACCGQVTIACVWPNSASQPTLLGTLASGNDGASSAYAINNLGRVVGETAVRVYTPIRYAGFQWQAGSGMSELSQLPGGDAGSVAYSINDSNVIVGDAFVGLDRRATRWANGSATNLGTLPNGSIGGSTARDINNSGAAVGYSFPVPLRAVVWPAGATQPMSLGALSLNHQSFANAINDSGVIVGRSNDRAFVWISSVGMVDLNNQVNGLNGHQIVDASDINNNGQIAAIARITINGQQVNRAVLLQPLPTVTCDSLDFNNDGSRYDPVDIQAFLSVYSQGPCVPAGRTCNDVDFNNDGSSFDPQDIQAFLSVYGEGPCF